MKKRLPLLISFIFFLALCASGAYWGMQLFKPKPRDLTWSAPAPQAELPLDGAASLFGGKITTVVASNYQLKGVLAPHDPLHGIAIIAADGRPSQSVPVGKEISPGVRVKEVHKRFVMIDENGVTKRVDMPETKGLSSGNSSGAIAALAPAPLPPPRPEMDNGQPSPPPPPPPANNLQNATGLGVPGAPNIRIGEPSMMGVNPGQEPTPKPAMPSEPNGPPVAK